MERYINADELTTLIQNKLNENQEKKGTFAYSALETFTEILQLMPTADVVPRAELERSLKGIRALSAFKDYFSDLYGQGLEIAKWHLNGDTEPFDSFYDSALDEYEASFLSKGIKDETSSR